MWNRWIAYDPGVQLNLFRRVAPVVGVVAMLICVAPGASAEPPGDEGDPAPAAAADDAAPDAGGPTISLGDLGSSTMITFKGDRQTTTASLAFPVPPGLVPMELTATMKLPTPARFGSLTVTQDDRFISRIGVGPPDVAPVTIPLAGTQVFGNYVSLKLTSTIVPIDGYCFDALNPVQLFDGVVKFAGSETVPTTVADFMPRVLRKLTVAVPANPSRAESDAAVQLIAAIQARYGGSKREYALVPLADGVITLPNPAGPLERQIILKEGPDKGLSLQPSPGVPALLVSGEGEELKNQTRLLTDDSLSLALTPKAVAGPLETKQKIVGNTATLKEMGMDNELTSIGLWPEVEIPVDQTKFGHALQGVRVHVIGSYTPLAPDFGGEVTAQVGGETIDQWPSDANATIDHWVDIPDRLLKRTTSLMVSVNTTGDAGYCGAYLPLNLRIANTTEVQVAGTSKPPLPAGFTSLPQTLMPRVLVGIGDNSFPDTLRAVQIISGVQRYTSIPIMTQVTSLGEAVASKDPAILIEADNWTQKSIGLPISAENGQITVKGFDKDDKFVTLTLQPATPVGSLQVVFDGERSVLIATSSGSAAQLDDLLRWLGSDSNRWSGLNGRAIISLPGQEAVAIPIPESELPKEDSSGGGAKGGFGIVWQLAAGVVAAAILGAVFIVVKTRGRGSKAGHRAEAEAPVDVTPDDETGGRRRKVRRPWWRGRRAKAEAPVDHTPDDHLSDEQP